MNKHHIRFHLLQHITHSRKHTSRHIIQILTLLHDIQIIIRTDIKNFKNLVQHLTVLTRNTHHSLKIVTPLLKLLHQRSHLYCLRACPEDKHHFFHICIKNYSLLKVISSVRGCTNSNSRVRASPSSRVNGALKPQEWTFVASNSVVAQNFFTLTDDTVSFFRVMNARASKQYPPSIPSQ